VVHAGVLGSGSGHHRLAEPGHADVVAHVAAGFEAEERLPLGDLLAGQLPQQMVGVGDAQQQG
jgi:hypothetical protein